MSFMDTIKGARQEAEANGNPFENITSNAEKADDNAADAPSTQRRTRRSAAKAKPSRQAAAGVRVVRSDGKPKSKANQTKEERKAERKHDREVGDLRYNVTQKVLEEREDYQKARKLWWKFLIGGVVLMVASIAIYMYVSRLGTNAPDWLGLLGITTMAGAYVVVIAGLIYDWRTIRPMRKEVDKYVQSMSEKRLVSAINKDAKKKSKNSQKKEEKRGILGFFKKS